MAHRAVIEPDVIAPLKQDQPDTMLAAPNITEARIGAALQHDYGIDAVTVTFLPLGADANAAVYCVVAADGARYFLKLKRGAFAEIAVTLPRFLHDQGITQIIAPRAANSGRLCANLDAFTAILYPYVDGHDGLRAPLSVQQWREFGAAVQRFHTLTISSSVKQQLSREQYGADYRERVAALLAALDGQAIHRHVPPIAGPSAIQLADLLLAKRATIADLIARATRLAERLQASRPSFVVCHTDLHAGNLLFNDDALFIVDWDNPILAPKERDLMFIGGAQGFVGCTPEEETRWFYAGYRSGEGVTAVDPLALAYYRYERIIQDIDAYWQELFLPHASADDCAQAVHRVAANFVAGGTVAVAYAADAHADGR